MQILNFIWILLIIQSHGFVLQGSINPELDEICFDNELDSSPIKCNRWKPDLKKIHEDKDFHFISQHGKEIKSHAYKFPHLDQGFKILLNENLHNQSFQDYLADNLIYNEEQESNLGEVIEGAEDIIITGMKYSFLDCLDDLISSYNIDIHDIEEPIFQYVVQYKDGFLKPVVREWVNLVTELDANNFLHKAIIYNKKEAVQFLIDAGVNVNMQFESKGTPMHEVARVGNIQIAGLLITAGAQIDIKDTYENYPIHIAIEMDHTEFAKKLINLCTNINEQDSLGRTFLHIAVRQNNIDLAAFLIAKGANLYIKNVLESIPLCIAVDQENELMVRLLLDNMNEVKVITRSKIFVNAMYKAHINIINMLIAAGIDLNSPDCYGKIPLESAMHYYDNRNSRYFEHEDNDNLYIEIVTILIRAGADVHIPCRNGLTIMEKILTSEMLNAINQAVRFRASMQAQPRSNRRATPAVHVTQTHCIPRCTIS